MTFWLFEEPDEVVVARVKDLCPRLPVEVAKDIEDVLGRYMGEKRARELAERELNEYRERFDGTDA